MNAVEIQYKHYATVGNSTLITFQCPIAGNDSTAFDQTSEVRVTLVHLLQDFEMIMDLLKICSCFFFKCKTTNTGCMRSAVNIGLMMITKHL
jgi:hypothetical protein